MGIEYWEIWNEPDLDQPDDRWKTDPRTWAGTMEQFDELYVVTAKHLKKCFPDLKIGGPAISSVNSGWLLEELFRYITRNPDDPAPMDFFSFHHYGREADDFARFWGRLVSHAMQPASNVQLNARYEFQDESANAAWNFAEMAATHRMNKDKKVEVEILPETKDFADIHDESEVDTDEE